MIASIPTAICPEILKAEVSSMSSFKELSISQLRDSILASSNSTSALEIIPTFCKVISRLFSRLSEVY